MNKSNNQQKIFPDNLVDPDPISIFLNILATVGSIASIVAFIEYKRDKRCQIKEKEEKLKFELSDLFMTLEVEHIELMGMLKGLEVVLLKGTEFSIPLQDLKFEFGGCRPVYTHQGYTKYDDILININRKCGKLIDLTSQILKRLYYYPIRLERSVFEELINFRDKLNEVLHRSMSYFEAFRIYEELLHYGQSLCRNLRDALRNA
jgi:hypothetical protein